ncbi:MobC family plasmid mobilization relaxosome protein [Burkholderia pseudomallei]|uniref:MobC family plasmid mobilization relaxosome protein n=1 Tax=Burkholderia pseudomallei TaxID=28450 RepID=UPI0021F6FEA0|nr:MobC family plasmid mobilization relaxosome protein [Burkholderia pseudomallei]MCV9913940.1 MobC family plasmid mobilization relaxosome protein [Burkholderia pseudomallei]MCW0071255.1 MobC family plasmid mobilization relaxosome protein [Burkholderia pseudomallei]
MSEENKFNFTREKIYQKKVHIYLTNEQKDKLDNDRKELGLNTSQLVRKLLSNTFVYTKYLSQLILEVKKFGNNLNQIARWCNETKQAGDEILPMLTEIRDSLRDLVNEVKRLK